MTKFFGEFVFSKIIKYNSSLKNGENYVVIKFLQFTLNLTAEYSRIYWRLNLRDLPDSTSLPAFNCYCNQLCNVLPITENFLMKKVMQQEKFAVKGYQNPVRTDKLHEKNLLVAVIFLRLFLSDNEIQLTFTS